jgi:orotidine-5'-phosphate decarboxylase
MTRAQLTEQVFLKNNYLCIGLDTDPEKIPVHLRSHPDPIFEFNKMIIDHTRDLCVAYKINTAFYEAMGIRGWEAMQRTVDYIPDSHFKIADAKRGDIGNTSSQYAKAFFEVLNFDAITVAPYMGEDSVRPFLEYENKWTIVLALTSNKGSSDFQQQKIGEEWLYEKVIKDVCRWGSVDNLMFVAGATKAEDLSAIRKIIPEHYLLVPGVGFQGGNLKEVSMHGLNKDCGLLVNVSRAIIFAGKKEDFYLEAAAIASQYKIEMQQYLNSIVPSS